MSDRTCPECGSQVTGHAGRKFCADICNYRAKERRRVEAGYYQQAHVRKRVNEQYRAKYRRDVATGSERGQRLAVWAAHGVNGLAEIGMHCVMDGCERPKFARLKCKPHYQREMLMAGNSWAATDLISGSDYERRAKAYGVPFEQFDKLDIYVRDGWTCGICAEPVNPELIYPDPMSASLDHVIPLSRGGGHLPSNTQCSHLLCNVRKGARHGEEIGARAGLA